MFSSFSYLRPSGAFIVFRECFRVPNWVRQASPHRSLWMIDGPLTWPVSAHASRLKSFIQTFRLWHFFFKPTHCNSQSGAADFIENKAQVAAGFWVDLAQIWPGSEAGSAIMWANTAAAEVGQVKCAVQIARLCGHCLASADCNNNNITPPEKPINF